MKLSIVTTLYQSALFIDEFYQRSTAVAKQLAGEDYEFILVNDGSPDNSLDLAYLAKIFSETKQRPYTIVRQIYSKRKNG